MQIFSTEDLHLLLNMEVILHDDLQFLRKFKWFCFDIFVTCNKAAHFLPGKLACVELMTFQIVVHVFIKFCWI